MTHGGTRPGAGRKKGSAAKLDAKARKAVIDSGQTPLDFLLDVMRDASHEFHSRLDAAKAAAPYVHSKLSTVDAKVTGKIDSTITFETIYEGKP
jgi:hypothetical protein